MPHPPQTPVQDAVNKSPFLRSLRFLLFRIECFRLTRVVEIIAHRGASADAPENTLASIELAWRQHADAVEVDVQFSKDGEIVVIHDAHTRRTAGFRGKVRGLTLAQLKKLDAGRWKHPKWAGERIPTLGEALAIVPPDKRFFIEIKCRAEALPQFEKIITRSPLPPAQIVTIGFDLELMARIKKGIPALEVCWISQFWRNWRTGGWRPKPETLIRKAREAGLDGLDLGRRGPINAKFMAQARAANLKVYVWTVDSPTRARRLLQAGVDGITSNRPGWLREKLSPRGT
jgi:glycerophosphoryl diester phosphodiesterase